MNKRQRKKALKKWLPITKNTVEYIGPLPPEFRKIEGTLETYHETGMEGIAFIIYNDSKDQLNPHFDPTKPESYGNIKKYKSLYNAHFIRKFDILELNGKRYALVPDKELEYSDNYRFSLYPIGFDMDKWIRMFLKEKTRAVIYTRSKKHE